MCIVVYYNLYFPLLYWGFLFLKKDILIFFLSPALIIASTYILVANKYFIGCVNELAYYNLLKFREKY